MLETIFGSESAAGVLSYLADQPTGSAAEIARYLGLNLYSVQKQLAKYEKVGLVEKSAPVSGRARPYRLNLQHPLATELRALLRKAARHRTSHQPKVNPLPVLLRPLFWDYPFEQLTWESDRELVIRRILSQGSWSAIEWLRKQLGDVELRRWLIDHRGRGLSPRQLRFWSLLLGVPRQQTNAWMRDRLQQPVAQ